MSKLHLSIVTLFKLHLEQMLVNYELVINLLFPEHLAMCLVSYLRIKDISSSIIPDDSLKIKSTNQILLFYLLFVYSYSKFISRFVPVDIIGAF